MKYAKVVNSKVVQTQPYEEEGFIEVPDNTVAGQIMSADGTFSNPPIDAAEAKEKIKLKVKAEAREKIIAFVNEDKQRNYTARYVELLKKQLIQGNLTQSENDEITAMAVIWARVKAIRASSDSIELEIDNLGSAEAVRDYVIEPNLLWSGE